MHRLFNAASIGNYNGLESALYSSSGGFDINEKNEQGDTLLHCAIKYAPMSECRKRFTVLRLTEFDADLGVTDAYGKTCFDLLRERCEDNTKEKWIREEYKKILIQITPSAKTCSDAVKAVERIKAEEKEAGTLFLSEVYKLKGITRSLRFRMLFTDNEAFNSNQTKIASMIDKNFLTQIRENVCEKTSQTGRAFLDYVYENICKKIDGGLQMTVEELKKEIDGGINNRLVGIAKKVNNEMCDNLPQRRPHTLQEISLLAIGTVAKKNVEK